MMEVFFQIYALVGIVFAWKWIFGSDQSDFGGFFGSSFYFMLFVFSWPWFLIVGLLSSKFSDK